MTARPSHYKPPVFVACLVPFLALLWDMVTQDLGANPVEYLTHRTGDWTLRFLLLTLAATPLRRLTGWSWPVRLRRMLGLFAFFYACLHFLVYAVLDLGLDVAFVAEDILERPYITVGFSAFVMLLPLAATSTNRMMRRLGRRWKTLHRLVYIIAALGVLHFAWSVKADLREPLVYAAILALLLGMRVWHVVQRRQAAAAMGVS